MAKIKKCKRCLELEDLLLLAQKANLNLIKEKEDWKVEAYKLIAEALSKM